MLVADTAVVRPVSPSVLAAAAPSTTPARRLTHIPALDGLRGVAWATVFATHAGLTEGVAGGQTVMFVFFGLSGFLITALIVNEHDTRGRVALGRFFARRAARLAPALVAFLVIWLGVVAIFGQDHWIGSVPGSSPGSAESLTVALQGVGAGLIYLTNWLGIFHVFTGYVPLGHLWSLAVEEQIYLFWAPLLVVLLLWRRRAALIGALVLSAASLVEVFLMVHAHHGGGGDRLYMGTDTRAAAFLVGGALAMLWARGGLSRWEVGHRSRLLMVSALVLIGASLLWLHDGTDPLGYSVGWVAATIGGPLLVVALVMGRHGWVGHLLSGPQLTYLGRRSYALYLWHYVWLTWLRSLGWSGVGLALLLSLVSAELSWRLVEARFLGHRRADRSITPSVPEAVIGSATWVRAGRSVLPWTPPPTPHPTPQPVSLPN